MNFFHSKAQQIWGNIGTAVGGTVGGLAGGVVGVLGGPAGIVAGAVAGATAGGTAGARVGLAIGALIDKLNETDITPETAEASEFAIKKYGDDIVLPQPKSFKWEEKTIQIASATKQKIAKATAPSAIVADDETAGKLVLAAKNGNWLTVKSILQDKPYLVNIIPVERAWSVLHQTVYHNNMEMVKFLISIENCDVDIRAKRDQANITLKGETPITYAEQHNCQQIKTLLENHKAKLMAQTIPSFIPETKKSQFYQHGAPFFLISFAFLNPSEVCQMKIENMSSMLELSKEIFHLLENNWSRYKQAIADSLYPFSSELYQQLKASTKKSDFYSTLVTIYTGEHVYSKVNQAMRRASALQAPTGDDMLLSLYSLCLQAILVNWTDLEPFTGTSFRGMSLTEDDAKSYTQGTTFMWFSFTSASQSEHVAGVFGNRGTPITFVITNGGLKAKIQPRKIDKLSVYKGECEVLFPVGTGFKVEKVEESNGRKVYLTVFDE